MATSDHSEEALRVYPSRTLDGGFWHPDSGDLRGPKGWEFLPSGDAFVTRTVKRLGPHWVVAKSRKGYTATLGILGPSGNIQEARALAQETEAERAAKRDRSRVGRDKRERKYRQQFADAVFQYLDFAPKNRELARQIAQGTAAQATLVSSGRVGRTTKLTLEEKAELAARAYIRHRHTSFEDTLMEQGLFEVDTATYREAKAEAHHEVDAFLRKHRRRDAPRQTIGKPK